jgi:hypothetical protein
MWAYQRSTCPDHPSPEEMSAVEVETRIHKVLGATVVLPPGAGPDPLRRGIATIRVGTSGPVSTVFTILSPHCARDIAQGLRNSRGNTQGADFSADAPGQATSHASNGVAWSCEEREREIGVPLVRR